MKKLCKQCKINFLKRPDRGIFCSHKCAGLNRIGFKNNQTTKDKISESAKKVGTGKWNKDKKYSEEHCKNIGKTKIGNKNFLGHKLSKEHIQKLINATKNLSFEKRLKKSERMKGEKCNFWKGGITSKNMIIRSSFEYKLWRKACMERDNFTCQKTGQRGGKLVVHHINNFADFLELRTSIENGITLSRISHEEFHKIYGKRNNTREQLEEYLNKLSI